MQLQTNGHQWLTVPMPVVRRLILVVDDAHPPRPMWAVARREGAHTFKIKHEHTTVDAISAISKRSCGVAIFRALEWRISRCRHERCVRRPHHSSMLCLQPASAVSYAERVRIEQRDCREVAR